MHSAPSLTAPPPPTTDIACRKERDRILSVYAGRPDGDYGFLNLWSLRLSCQRQMLLARKLRQAGIQSVVGKRVLDVGCGDGRFLRLLNHFGADPSDLHGCDINSRRLAAAADLHPSIRWRETDGADLPYGDAEFDFVCQSTVFTSILDPSMKERLAIEMARVCKPDGAILWFDFRYNNPRNPAVRGVGSREIARLFPGWSHDLDSVGLLPPLARLLVGRCTPIASLLEWFSPLRYAHLGILRRAATEDRKR